MTEPDRQKQQDGFNIGESGGMDSAEQEIFLEVKRSKSDESFLGKLLTLNKSQFEKRPLIISINNDHDDTHNNNGFKVFKKPKKQRKKNQSDYRKNICGYITKKIIRQFVSPNYSVYVMELCQKHDCSYVAMKSYYLSQIQRITGPSHIPGLLIPDKENEIAIKNVFRDFFEWFLKERYLRYLLIEGKMADKKAYIQYKNNILMGILAEAKEGGTNVERSIKLEENRESQMEEQESEEESEESQKREEKGKQEKQQSAEKSRKNEKMVPMIPIVKKEAHQK